MEINEKLKKIYKLKKVEKILNEENILISSQKSRINTKISDIENLNNLNGGRYGMD